VPVRLFLREHGPRWSILMLVYAAVVWFAIIYLGHHYLVDALGGIVYPVAAYAVAGGLQPWLGGAVHMQPAQLNDSIQDGPLRTVLHISGG